MTKLHISNENYWIGQESAQMMIMDKIRKAMEQLKRVNKVSKAQFYKWEVKDFELFEQLKADGRIKEIKPGLWEVK